MTLLRASAAGRVHAAALAQSSVRPCEPLIVINMYDTIGSSVILCEPLRVISRSATLLPNRENRFGQIAELSGKTYSTW